MQKVAKFLTVFEKGTHRVPLHSSDPPFFKGGEVNFNCPPGGGGSENQRKGGGSMVQVQVFLKRGLELFLFNFFKVYHLYISRVL